MTKKFISLSILIHILLIILFFNVNYDFKKKSEINNKDYKSLNVSLYEIKKYEDINYVEEKKEIKLIKNNDIKNNYKNKNEIDFIDNDFINKINKDFNFIKNELKKIEDNMVEQNIIENTLIEVDKDKDSIIETKKNKDLNKIKEIIPEKKFRIKENVINKNLATKEDKKKYIYKLKKIIYQNWDQSKGKKGWDCRVEVIQNNYGSIIKINYLKCHDNLDFKNSIKKALYTSSPFPLPEKDQIFHNILDFTFIIE